jgi:hypothetical protein
MKKQKFNFKSQIETQDLNHSQEIHVLPSEWSFNLLNFEYIDLV